MKIGHVHLTVSNIERSLSFYRDLLGFDVTMEYGDSAVFLSKDGYHHHIGLNTWAGKGARAPEPGTTGLYHFAILYPSRKDLATVLKRLMDANYPLVGASDHGVSEAIYLSDPDDIGVELYADRAREEWPQNADGKIEMFTKPLDIVGLLQELEEN